NHEIVQALNSVKDSIGEWHDWEELLAIAKDVLDHGNCKLLRELKSTADRKYAEALAQAESMRKKYLRIDRHKNSRTNRKGVPEPTWMATTSLAAYKERNQMKSELKPNRKSDRAQLQVIIETSKGSRNKFKYDPTNESF